MKQSKKVGRYHIMLNQVLGSGSFATTYKAYRDKDKQTVYGCKAINKQMIKSEYKNTDYIIERIRYEFEVLQELDHQNIIRFQDSQETKLNIYLFLEYCPNGTLKEYIDLHRHDHHLQEQLSFAQQIIQGCFYLQQRGIVHRDIKPENILFKGKNVKIADFGLAKHLNQQDSYQGTIVGTVHYMAPQILRESKSKQTKKCDVWSAGITIYQLVTGYLPFQMSQKLQSPLKILQNVQKKQEHDWSQIKDPLLRTLIFKMLVVDPNKRITFEYACEIIANFNQQ